MPDSKPPHLPVLIETPQTRTRRAQAADDPAFSAQALGQSGQKRGLKGGAPVLNAARQSYLHTQWAGPGDRRQPAGVLRRDEV